MTKFLDTPLFGSALFVELPANFSDISKMRQVPDNQEVYMDRDGFTSIIFEICDRVGPDGNGPETDGGALSTHLEEIVGDDVDAVRVWSTSETQFSKLEGAPELEFAPPTYTLMATHTTRTDQSIGSNDTTDFTAIILTLLRLEKQRTDVLITINVPHIRGKYNEQDIDLEMGKCGQLIGDAVEYASHIWSSFRIKDWKLLDGE